MEPIIYRNKDELELDFQGFRSNSIHPYPATMPLPLAETLVEKYSSAGDCVFDPFMGSGTTLLAAHRLGRDAIGSDLNPLACLIARVRASDSLSDGISGLDSVRKTVWESIESTAEPIHPDDMWTERIDRWFSPRAQHELGILAAVIKGSMYTGFEQDMLLLAFSRTVRQCSFARPGELKLWRREDTSTLPNPITTFFAEFLSAISVISEHLYDGKVRKSYTKVYHGDAIDVMKYLDNVQLVLTSPPYGDAWTTVAYGNFTMLNRIWLSAIDNTFSESDPSREDDLLPGGRFRNELSGDFSEIEQSSPEFRSVFAAIEEENTSRAQEFASFICDIEPIYSHLAGQINHGGTIVNVVGPRQVSGVVVDTGKIISELLVSKGLTHVERLNRQVTGKRMPTRQGMNTGTGELINSETIDITVR